MMLNTYVINYPGQMVLNGNSSYVRSIILYNSGAVGLSVTTVACGDIFCLNFKQSFESDRYVKAFLDQLNRLEIPFLNSDAIAFVPPKDSII